VSEFFDSIEGIAPLVGPMKITNMTFKRISNGKVEYCIGVPCTKEQCKCGYYDESDRLIQNENKRIDL